MEATKEAKDKGQDKGAKEAFVEKMDAQMDEWKKRIDEMEAEADAKEAQAEAEKADAKLKKQLYEKVHGLRQGLERTKNRLERLRKSGDDSWRSFRKEVENAGNDLRKGIESAISRFK